MFSSASVDIMCSMWHVLSVTASQPGGKLFTNMLCSNNCVFISSSHIPPISPTAADSIQKLNQPLSLITRAERSSQIKVVHGCERCVNFSDWSAVSYFEKSDESQASLRNFIWRLNIIGAVQVNCSCVHHPFVLNSTLKLSRDLTKMVSAVAC